MTINGFNAVVVCDIPMGGGLSSSAALEVSTATLIEAMTGHAFDPLDKVLMCQKAEHEFAGTPCGIMDQFITSRAQANHLMLLDCRNNEPTHVPFGGDEVAILIADTRVKHDLAEEESPYARRRASCESAAQKLGVSSLRDVDEAVLLTGRALLSDEESKRARHVIGEIERTVEAVSAIERCDWTRFGELMNASHASLRDDYEVSCDELDAMVEAAHAIG
ncbi:MAG: galactokinase, partial [Planctomycetota bacterium]